ncbi:MAG: pyridoxine 5'-phosphate synthase [Elusimicrobia bacterium RIFOXYA2_FULL_50_26]|nr:MAG: pyridoxine 5'-phosphate synthase [Elusimicrobia bacterium RIFOXYA2_FULL_50_26]OGS24814.1 MAG: pyridoxine 5'-phosphate synthase [Elusimicrobia bacterium RIFOXYB2_FULL_50_12]
MVKLGINIDHVATVRQARGGREPDPVTAAAICELAGADGITVHLREDRRHIQDRDVELLRKTVKTKLNLEMAAADEIIKIAVRLKPDDVCLVPEKRRELTTEGGLDVHGRKAQLAKVVATLKKAGICVSLFIDPVAGQVRAAAEINADCVELHTGAYAHEFDRRMRRPVKSGFIELERIRESAAMALDLGLTVNAGHGLDYSNVYPVAAIGGMNELNIGFSIIARAMFTGLEEAVREMKVLLPPHPTLSP